MYHLQSFVWIVAKKGYKISPYLKVLRQYRGEMTYMVQYKAVCDLWMGVLGVHRERDPIGLSNQWRRFCLGKGRRKGCVSMGGAQSWGEENLSPGEKKKTKFANMIMQEIWFFSFFEYSKDLNFVKHVGQDTYFEANFHSVFNTFL